MQFATLVSAAQTNSAPGTTAMDPKVLAKQWGALAALSDTLWAEGQDQLIDFVWAEPGSRMTITIQGFWGRRVVTVSPSANPKLMTAWVNYTDTGDTAEGTLAPTAAGYVLTAGGARETCTKSKAALNCVIETQLPNGKFTFDAGHVFRPTDYSGAQALLANLTQTFPLRPSGKYDPLGGMFAGIDRPYRFADGSQILFNEWTNKSGYRGLSYGILGPDGDYRDYRSYARLEGYPDSAYSLRAEVFAGTTFRTILTGISRPARMLRGGRFMFEQDDGSLWILSLSADKQSLLSQIATRQGKGWSITSASMATSPAGPADTRKWGAVGKLAGRLWSGTTYRGTVFEGYQWIDDKRMLRRIWTNEYMKVPHVVGYCVIQPIDSTRLECKGQEQNGKIDSVYSLSGPNSFDLNGLRYELKTENSGAASSDIFIATRVSDGTSTDVFLREGSSWDLLAAAGRQGFDRRRSRELAMQAREESAAKEREAAMWRGAIAAVFGNSGGSAPNPLFEPSPVFVSSPGPALPGMGGIIHVPSSKMTPQEQARWDELERFKMAEQRRRGETPTTFVDDARGATGSSAGSSENATSGPSSASSSGSARQASLPAPPPARPAPRPLEVVLSVVPSVSEKDKTQPLCISTVMTLGNWPEGYDRPTIVREMVRQHFARFVSACRNARGDLRSALPETVSFVDNESADTGLVAYINQSRASNKASWLVTM